MTFNNYTRDGITIVHNQQEQESSVKFANQENNQKTTNEHRDFDCVCVMVCSVCFSAHEM